MSDIKNAKIDVTIEKQDELIIPAYDKVIEYQYATPVTEEG